MFKIQLAKKTSTSKGTKDLYKDQYKNWKNLQQERKEPFFMLYKDFEKHLKHISQGALKLYLYYGFKSKNDTGESWHPTHSISDDLDVSQRSIENWNKELIERGLISRKIVNGRNKTTFLLPLSMNLKVFKTDDELKATIDVSDFKDIYGEPSKCFHLFQWRKDKTTGDKYNIPYNIIALVYAKKSEQSNFPQETVFIRALESSTCEIELAASDFKTDIYQFSSDINVGSFAEGFSKAEGIAVKTQHNLKNISDLDGLISELLNEDTTLEDYTYVTLVNQEEE